MRQKDQDKDKDHRASLLPADPISMVQTETLPKSSMRELLREAQKSVCSMLCASAWKTIDGPPAHSELCRAITERLSTAPRQALGLDSRAFGKHEHGFSHE